MIEYFLYNKSIIMSQNEINKNVEIITEIKILKINK